LLADRQRRAQERTAQTAEELQRAYAELRQTFAQLLQTEKLASLGELSAGLVHEIRNPLAGIKGAVEILAEELAPNSPRREFAALAQREIDRLDKLVNEFLSFARPAQLAQTPADVNGIVRSVAALLEQPAAAQNVAFRQELAMDLPLVTVDAEQVKQVMLNLALNALQAMPDGGIITFRTASQADFLTLEVEDEGGGVAPAIAGRIFDPFFTTKEKGVGLGLSVAHRIAAQHGGALTLANVPHGAIFQLNLPASYIGS
jgi:signal transduction histidine kinase